MNVRILKKATAILLAVSMTLMEPISSFAGAADIAAENYAEEEMVVPAEAAEAEESEELSDCIDPEEMGGRKTDPAEESADPDRMEDVSGTGKDQETENAALLGEALDTVEVIVNGVHEGFILFDEANTYADSHNIRNSAVTLRLLGNITADRQHMFVGFQNLTIDLNGYYIRASVPDGLLYPLCSVITITDTSTGKTGYVENTCITEAGSAVVLYTDNYQPCGVTVRDTSVKGYNGIEAKGNVSTGGNISICLDNAKVISCGESGFGVGRRISSGDLYRGMATLTVKDGSEIEAVKNAISVYNQDAAFYIDPDSRIHGDVVRDRGASAGDGITGGLYSEIPDKSALKDGYCVTLNLNDGTKAEYPYMVTAFSADGFEVKAERANKELYFTYAGYVNTAYLRSGDKLTVLKGTKESPVLGPIQLIGNGTEKFTLELDGKHLAGSIEVKNAALSITDDKKSAVLGGETIYVKDSASLEIAGPDISAKFEVDDYDRVAVQDCAFSYLPKEELLAGGWCAQRMPLGPEDEFPYKIIRDVDVTLPVWNVMTRAAYETLSQALLEVDTGRQNELILLKNLSGDEETAWTLPEGADVVVELNGKAVCAKNDLHFVVPENAKLIFRDTSDAREGVVTDCPDNLFTSMGGTIEVQLGTFIYPQEKTTLDWEEFIPEGWAVTFTADRRTWTITPAAAEVITSDGTRIGLAEISRDYINGRLTNGGTLRLIKNAEAKGNIGLFENNTIDLNGYDLTASINGSIFSYGTNVVFKGPGTIENTLGKVHYAYCGGGTISCSVTDGAVLKGKGLILDYYGTEQRVSAFDINMDDGQLISTSDGKNRSAIRLNTNNSSGYKRTYRVNISGGTVDGDIDLTHSMTSLTYVELNLSGGFYSGKLLSGSVPGCVTGGYFKIRPADRVIAADHTVVPGTEEYPYQVVKGEDVAEVIHRGSTSGEKYNDLKKAAAAAIDGDTVRVLRNVEVAETVDFGNTTGSAKEVTLDLNGHTISGPVKGNSVISAHHTSFVVTDTSGTGNGAIINTADIAESTRALFIDNSQLVKASLTVANVTLRAADRAVEVYCHTPNNIDLAVENAKLTASDALYVQFGLGNMELTSGFFSGNLRFANSHRQQSGGVAGGHFTAAPEADFLANGYVVFDADEKDAEYQTYKYVVEAPCTVTFVNEGETYETQNVRKGRQAAEPAVPSGTGIFEGWYTADGEKWNFASPVMGNMTLTARWGSLEVVYYEYDSEKPAEGTGAALAEALNKAGQSAKQHFEIVLVSDVMIPAGVGFEVHYGGNFSIDMNGHSLTGRAAGSMLNLFCGKVTVKDSSEAQTGIIRNESDSISAVTLSVSGKGSADTLSIESGWISGVNAVTTSAGAVTIGEYAYITSVSGTGASFGFSAEAAALDVSGRLYGAVNYTGAGSYDPENGLAGGYYSISPDPSLIRSGYSVTEVPDPEYSVYKYHIVNGVSVDFKLNIKDPGSKAPESQFIPAGGKVTDPGTVFENGYVFGGWYTAKEGSTEIPVELDKLWNFEADTVSDPLTLYAKLDPAKARIVRSESLEGVPVTKMYFFRTLEDALAAAWPDDTIDLMDDCAADGTLSITRSVEINLNGKMLSGGNETSPLIRVGAAVLTVSDYGNSILPGTVANDSGIAAELISIDGCIAVPEGSVVQFRGKVQLQADVQKAKSTEGIKGGRYTKRPDENLAAEGFAFFENAEENSIYQYLVDRVWNVTWNSEGRADIPSEVVRNNTRITPQDPGSREGFVFAGWYTGTGENAIKWNFDDPVTADLDLAAHWNTVTVTVTYTEIDPATQAEIGTFTEGYSSLQDALDRISRFGTSEQEKDKYFAEDVILTLKGDFENISESVVLNIPQPYTAVVDLAGKKLTGSVSDAALITVRNGAKFRDSSAGGGLAENTAGDTVAYIVPMAGGMPEITFESGEFRAKELSNVITVDTPSAGLVITGGKYDGVVCYTDSMISYTDGRKENAASLRGGAYTVEPDASLVEKGYSVKTSAVEGEKYKYTIEQDKYTVTFVPNGGSPAPAVQEHTYGEKVTEPEAMTPPTDTQVFAGWFTEDKGEAEKTIAPWNFAEDTVTGDLTLYAWWNNVIADVYYEGITDPVHCKTIDELKAAVNDPEKTGARTVNMLTSVSTTQEIVFTTNENVTLNLSYHTIHAKVDGGAALRFDGTGKLTINAAEGLGEIINDGKTQTGEGGAILPAAVVKVQNGSLLVNNGSLSTGSANREKTFAVMGDAVTIVGGRFTGRLGTAASSGKFTLTGGYYDSVKSGSYIDIGGKNWIRSTQSEYEETPYTLGTAAASYLAPGKAEVMFGTMDEAVSFANQNGGGVLKLYADSIAAAGTAKTYTFTVNVTIDLNGHRLSHAHETDPVIDMKSGGLVITDSSNGKTGHIDNTLVTETGPEEGTASVKVYHPAVRLNDARQTVSIDNGWFMGRFVDADGKALTGGKVTGGWFTSLDSGMLAEGYIFTGYSGDYRHVVLSSVTLKAYSLKGTFRVSCESFNSDYDIVTVTKPYGSDIPESTFAAARTDGSKEYHLDGWYECEIVDGKVERKPGGRKWNGGRAVESMDLVSVWSLYVAKIGDAKYTSLGSAIGAAENGDSITLLQDIGETVTVNGKKLTIDLNGKKIQGSSSTWTGIVSVIGGGALTIVGAGSIINSGKGSALYAAKSDLFIKGAGRGSTQIQGGDGINFTNSSSNHLNVSDASVKGSDGYGIKGDGGKINNKLSDCDIEGSDGSLDETMCSESDLNADNVNFKGK